MNTRTIVCVVLAWLALNIVVPLFVNSIERLYKKRIDAAVKGTLSLSRRLLFFLVRVVLTIILSVSQLLLTILMLPTLLWVPVAEKFLPRLFTIEVFDNYRNFARLAVKLDFWGIVLGLKKPRNDKEPGAV